MRDVTECWWYLQGFSACLVPCNSISNDNDLGGKRSSSKVETTVWSVSWKGPVELDELIWERIGVVMIREQSQHWQSGLIW